MAGAKVAQGMAEVVVESIAAKVAVVVAMGTDVATMAIEGDKVIEDTMLDRQAMVDRQATV